MKPSTPIVPGMDLEVTEIAKSQSQYLTLPAFVDGNGVVLTRWGLSWRERLCLLWQGFFYLETWTFKSPLQPVRLSLDAPDFE